MIKVFAVSFAVLFFGSVGLRAEGVNVGGDVRINTTTGDRSAKAEGEGAIASSCIGSISGSDVTISGDVTINGSGDPSGKCLCAGDCPEVEKKTTGQSE